MKIIYFILSRVFLLPNVVLDESVVLFSRELTILTYGGIKNKLF